MFLFGTKRFDPDQFENDLKKITSQISNNEKKLRKLKSQKKHYKKIIPLYLTSAYCIYFSILYQRGTITESKNVLFLVAIPLIIGLFYYAFLSLYDYLINNKESHIEYLKNEHGEKLNLLKEKTNFDKTKDLLARFSNGEDLQEMEKEANEINRKKAEYMKLIQSGEQGKILEDLQKHQTNNSGFYDHFLTALLGENEMSPDKRYALICGQCFTHNGLAPPGQLASQVKYRCPRCGFFNGANQLGDTATLPSEKPEEKLEHEEGKEQEKESKLDPTPQQESEFKS